MKKFRLSTAPLLVVIFTLGFASLTHAQATRTWVSGVGDDANPCSRTAPCKTWAGAISKTAAGGEINALDDGGFGAVTIVKAITLDGGGHMASILAAGTNGINVNAGANDTVTLRGLDINGAGTGLVGISINSGKAVHIEECRIYGFRAGTARGISDNRSASVASPPQLFVNDVFIRDNLNGGIGITGTTPSVIRAFIRNCRIQNNGGFGVLGSSAHLLTVENCMISGNTGDAVRVEGTAFAAVISNILNNNGGGGVVTLAGGGAYLADNTIFTNGSGATGAIVSFGNNNVRNNTAGNTLPAPVGQQ